MVVLGRAVGLAGMTSGRIPDLLGRSQQELPSRFHVGVKDRKE